MQKKTFIMLAVAMALGAAEAYQPVAGMKTAWGEKVTPENVWREYPRPQMTRTGWTNLNGLWQYAVTKDAPHVPEKWDGEILVPFVIESQLSGVGRLLDPKETLWYRRSFEANVKTGERLLLHFEQADFRTMVFVNGIEAGVPHEGGQVPFTFDITDLVKKGANDLVVAIWDPTTGFIGSVGKQTEKPAGCLYTRSSGIGGTVWLETVPERYIKGYKVVADVDNSTVRIDFDIEGCGDVDVKVDGLSSEPPVSRLSDHVVEVKIPNAKLWSPETPHLYGFTAKCGKDKIRGYFGMRKFEMRKDPNGALRFYLNNKHRFIIGALDQGWWPEGLLTPPSDEAMAYDIRKLKEMGYDMLRKHIKVEPRRYYYLCDKIGILVLQDMPSGFKNSETRYGFYRREWQEVMDHLQTTPSIVMWVPYNEGWGQPGPFLTHSTLMWTQRYDPTRLVDGPSGAHDWEGGEVWNERFPTQHPSSDREEAAHVIDKHDYCGIPQMHPVNDRRASFLGEFGGIGCRVGGHLWTTNAWGYGNTGNDTDRAEVQAKFLAMMEHVAALAEQGLAGCVYTQTTDVEGEINGLLTYDRKVLKIDSVAVKVAHQKVREGAMRGFRPRTTKRILPRLDPSPTAWAWTTERPAEEWTQPGFDDSVWKRSAGGFGNPGVGKTNPAAKVATHWTTKTLWLRRHFEMDESLMKTLRNATFDMFHDEGVEVHLNGKPILGARKFNTDWTPFVVAADKFAAAVKPGDNVLAIKVSQTAGGQYFDCGLSVDLTSVKQRE